MSELVNEIGMERATLHFWDYVLCEDSQEYEDDPDHLKGTSAVQFIRTSNVTIHVLDKMRRVYLNIFSCKKFDEAVAKVVVKKFWGGRIMQSHMGPRI